jgi:hypothetical protein
LTANSFTLHWSDDCNDGFLKGDYKMAIKQIPISCVSIEDKPGSLQKLLSQIAESNVDLLCAAAFTTGRGQGLAYLSAKDPQALNAYTEKAKIDLTPAAGFIINESDTVGAAAAALKPLADAGINGLAGTAMVCDGQYYMLIIVSATDGDAAAKALGL